MTSRFMTDPHAMRDMAGRFEVHAQTVEDEARRMWASAQNISGAGWSGMAEATSLDTMTQMNQAFRNIVNMLHGVRDGLVRDANNYEQQEQASQQILVELAVTTCPRRWVNPPGSSRRTGATRRSGTRVRRPGATRARRPGATRARRTGATRARRPGTTRCGERANRAGRSARHSSRRPGWPCHRFGTPRARPPTS